MLLCVITSINPLDEVIFLKISLIISGSGIYRERDKRWRWEREGMRERQFPSSGSHPGGSQGSGCVRMKAGAKRLIQILCVDVRSLKTVAAIPLSVHTAHSSTRTIQIMYSIVWAWSSPQGPFSTLRDSAFLAAGLSNCPPAPYSLLPYPSVTSHTVTLFTRPGEQPLQWQAALDPLTLAPPCRSAGRLEGGGKQHTIIHSSRS